MYRMPRDYSDKLYEEVGGHKDSDFHSNPWSEILFGHGSDDSKHKRKETNREINLFIIFSAEKMPGNSGKY